VYGNLQSICLCTLRTSRDLYAAGLGGLINLSAGFIAKSWHVTSKGMFAGCCIGVILLVMSLEFLRRASREYDRFIVRGAQRQHHQITSSTEIDSTTASSSTKPAQAHVTTRQIPQQFRPSLLQQGIRALFHMIQFAVAYFIMLLAMYYNGYIIISIIIGAFLGAFIFSWEPIILRLVTCLTL